ncbi:AAA family ATPase [Parvularcula sp. IMCC14364]|uniref:AAA family ATPase n=1 Tax=Parvularcula sp. IMCC14364 TaxID=3067902 RepID=UPI0035568986
MSGADTATQTTDILARFSDLSGKMQHARTALGEVVFGQERVIEEMLIALLSGGHALLVGAPGLAKTLLVASCAKVTGLTDKRIQFTPDLMPADVIGSEVLEEGADGRRSFRFIEGPVFCQLLMADEINRASPRTQSALLQAMQEHHVTVAGARRDLPTPFHVLATQNPIEQEGTYPLPEAQLDRFLLQINIDYPPESAERQMLAATTGTAVIEPAQAMTPADLMAAQAMVRAMPIGEQIIDRIMALVRAARPGIEAADDRTDLIAWGPGPRASQALSLAVRARALMDGREAPSPDDIAALAGPILRHRMALTFAARAEGLTTDIVIDNLVQSIV